MKILYKKRKDEELAKNIKSLVKKYGPVQSGDINSLLYLLDATPRLSSIPKHQGLAPHRLTCKKSNRIFCSLNIQYPYRMIVSPVGEYDQATWQDSADTIEVIALYVDTHAQNFDIHDYI